MLNFKTGNIFCLFINSFYKRGKCTHGFLNFFSCYILDRMDEQNAERSNDMDELKTRLLKENAFLKSMASKPMSVYFDAYRTKAYDGGGEENLTFQVYIM